MNLKLELSTWPGGEGRGGAYLGVPPLPPVYWHFVALPGSELNQGTASGATAAPTQSVTVPSEPLTSASVCSGLGIFCPITAPPARRSDGELEGRMQDGEAFLGLQSFLTLC